MALQFSTAYRNALLDQLATTAGSSEVIKIFTGAVPANCAAADSGTLLVEFDLAATSWSTAASGAKTLADLTLAATAGGTGSAGYFRLYNTGATTAHMQGTVTATGGGGDMTVDNVSIANGQTVNITGFTLTAPGA